MTAAAWFQTGPVLHLHTGTVEHEGGRVEYHGACRAIAESDLVDAVWKMDPAAGPVAIPTDPELVRRLCAGCVVIAEDRARAIAATVVTCAHPTDRRGKRGGVRRGWEVCMVCGALVPVARGRR